MTRAGSGTDWFAFDAGATASAGRQATEYKRDAVAQLREALTLRPAATELSYVLAQVRRAVTSHALCRTMPGTCFSNAQGLLCAWGSCRRQQDGLNCVTIPSGANMTSLCRGIADLRMNQSESSICNDSPAAAGTLTGRCRMAAPRWPCTASFLYHQPDSSVYLQGLFAVSHLDVDLG